MRDMASQKRAAHSTDDRPRGTMGDGAAYERAGPAADQGARRAAAVAAIDVMMALRTRAILGIGGRHRHGHGHGQNGKADK